MLTGLRRKLTTAQRVYNNQGVSGVVQVTKQRLSFGLAMHIAPWTGNRIRFENCKFLLDDTVITRELKAEILAGIYEKPEREAVKRFVEPSLPVVEMGGGIGIVSCILNKKLTIFFKCHLCRK